MSALADFVRDLEILGKLRESMRVISELDRSPRAADDQIQEAYFESSPRRRKYDRKKAIRDLGAKANGILQRERDRLKNLFDADKEMRLTVIERLTYLADEIELTEDDEWTDYYYSHVGNYRTTGYGVDRYARADAALETLHPYSYGIRTKIEEIRDPVPGCQHGFTKLSGFQVQIRLSRLGIAILRSKKPKVSTQDRWEVYAREGVNPRVFEPWMSIDDVKKFEKWRYEWRRGDDSPT